MKDQKKMQVLNKYQFLLFSSYPYKSDYSIGETFDPEGMALRVVYKNGEETVTHEIAGIVEKGTGTIPKALVGGTKYDFTVQAISADNNPNTGNSSSEESSKITLSFDTIVGS